MKQTGLGDRLFVAGYDLSGDTGSLSAIGGGPAALGVTGIDKEAQERIGGRRDGRIDFESFFNPSAGQAHPVLSALPRSDVLLAYFRGTGYGSPAAAIVAKQVNYDPSIGADGALTIGVNAQGQGYGLEWGRQVTPGIETDTGAANGTGVDFAAETDFGLQAYLHVFSFTGTDATIKLQESSDDASGDAYADVVGGAFTEVTSGPTAERIATANDQTIERYLRAVTITTGGFSELSFAVLVVKNEVAGQVF